MNVIIKNDETLTNELLQKCLFLAVETGKRSLLVIENMRENLKRLDPKYCEKMKVSWDKVLLALERLTEIVMTVQTTDGEKKTL